MASEKSRSWLWALGCLGMILLLLQYDSARKPDRKIKIVIEQYGEMFVASCENGNGSAFASDPSTAVRDLSSLVTLCGATGVDMLKPAVQHAAEPALQFNHALPWRYVRELREKGLLDD